jgi:hypothetical protein
MTTPSRDERSVDLGMQRLIRSTILRLIDRTPGVIDPAVVRNQCPGADSRDIQRAMELLVTDGLIALPSPSADHTGTWRGVHLTELGRTHLTAAG